VSDVIVVPNLDDGWGVRHEGEGLGRHKGIVFNLDLNALYTLGTGV